MILPPEIFATILRHTRDVHLLVNLRLLNLASLEGMSRLLPQQWCQALVLQCSPQDIIDMYTSGHAQVAEAIISLHINSRQPGGRSTLSQSPHGSYRNGTAGVGRDLLDTAVKYGTKNKLLVRMLTEGGCSGYRPLVVAAEEGRFDTLRALFYNDFFGNCYIVDSALKAVFQYDNVEIAEWIFTNKSVENICCTRDIVSWCEFAAEFDSVKIFIHLHTHHLEACTWAFVNQVIENKATRILQWMVQGGCSAIRIGAIGYAAGHPSQDPTFPYDDPDWDSEENMERRQRRTRNSEACDYLKENLHVLRRNEDTMRCGQRYYVPHYDYYTFGVLTV